MKSLTDEQHSLFIDGGQLDDYEVLKPIGKGKFSVVYKAKRRHDGQAVALKKIANFDIMNVKAREKTLKEVRLVQSVRHPNIIQYLDAFVQNNELCIAFEWAEAGDLKRQIRKANEKEVRFDERTIWRYFTQLCGALLYLHQNRIMHRDLKPANIFLTLKGVIKVGDLGLGRYLSANTLEARSKVGTPLYMSPEVLRGESYDWKSDVWSMGCILYELAMLRSPFKSEGLNLVGLFEKINKGYYEEISAIYSEHLRNLVNRMVSLSASDRPSVQEVWDICLLRPSSAALQKRITNHHAAAQNNNVARTELPATKSARSEGSKSKAFPESENQPRSSSFGQKQGILHQSRPLSSQEDTRYAVTDVYTRRRQAEVRMEFLFERLKILRYETVLKKPIVPTHFAFESQALLSVSPQSRFKDMCVLSYWLISLLDGEVSSCNESPIVIVQSILLAAGKVGVLSAAHLSAPTLISGVGIEVCELLDELAIAVISGKAHRGAPPTYPMESIETITSCDDEQQNESSNRVGESTASLVIENEDVFSRWIVVEEENQQFKMTGNEENAMIYTNVDPIAWDRERRRMLPKLQAALQDKFQCRISDSSWHVRLDHFQTQNRLIATVKDGVLQEIAQIHSTHQKQTALLERFEKHVNQRFLRARRLYHESTMQFKKSHDEMLLAQERVNRGTMTSVRLQAAHSELTTALEATNARMTSNSRLLERERQVERLIEENRELGTRFRVLHDYWTHKQRHAHQLKFMS